MMKWLLSFIILTYFACTSLAQNKSDVELAGLKGPVKSVLYTSHVAVVQGDSIVRGQEKWENEGSFNNLTVYNKAGYEIEELEYGPYGAMRTVIYRDDRNREVENYSYDSQGNLAFKNLSRYNADGQLVEGVSYDMEDSSLSSVITFIYDSNGNKIEEQIHNYNDIFTGGETHYSFYFEYDRKGNVLRQTGGQLHFEYLYEYDKNGKQTDEKVMDSTGRMFTRTLTMYDANGYVMQRQRINTRDAKENEKECSMFEYDANGNQLRYIYCDGDCKPQGSIVKSYDGQNRIVEYLEVSSTGEVEATYTYKYKVDRYGNWTHKYVFLEGQPTYIIEREIEYY